jgi:hypothetical protein
VARLNLAKLRMRLTELRQDQVDSIGVPVAGPFKRDHTVLGFPSFRRAALDREPAIRNPSAAEYGFRVRELRSRRGMTI